MTIIEAKHDAVKLSIQTAYPNWNIGNMTLIGSGLEFLAFKADLEEFGTIVIRTPLERWISNDNDAQVDARDLLLQEAALIQHFRQYHIPVPTFITLHLADDIDYLISSFVSGFMEEPDPYHFGMVMRSIHDSPVPLFAPVMLFGQSLSEILAQRIAQRMEVVTGLVNEQIPQFTTTQLVQHIDEFFTPTSVLHMDARPANLLVEDKRIHAILDWSNALIGPPALELARIDEYGHLNGDFLKGYEAAGTYVKAPPIVDLIYHLDTAVMLAVVFLSEAPDEILAKSQVERVKILSTQLSTLLNEN